MEQTPLNVSSPEKPEKDASEAKDKKTKRPKKGVFAGVVESASKQAPEKPEPTPFEKAVASLAVTKQTEAKSAEPKKSDEKDTAKSEPTVTEHKGVELETDADAVSDEWVNAAANRTIELSEKSETNDEDDLEDTEDTRETFSAAEILPLDQISGGEVIINLRGNTRPEPEVQSESVKEVTQPMPETAAAPIPEPAPFLQFNTQPQQQHQTRQYEQARPEPDESAPEAAVSGGEATKDSYPSAHHFQAPTASELYNQQLAVNAAYEAQTANAPSVASNPNEKLVTQQQLEDEVYRAEKAGQNRGVVAGALLIGGYEHFKHRRREKRMEKAAKNQAKEFEKERDSAQWKIAEQSKQLNQSERQLQQALAEKPAPAPLSESAPRFAPAEKTQQQRQETEFKKQLEKMVPKKEKPAPVETPKDGQLEIPADHHLETSAWHTIEVDSKTGKPVENPTFAYGEEYHRERAHEVGPRDDDHAAATGEVALVAAAQASNDSADAATQQAAMGQSDIPLATTHVQSKPTDKLKHAAKQTMQTSGPLWPLVLAFVVVVVLIIIAL